jgi:hypothetical protein
MRWGLCCVIWHITNYNYTTKWFQPLITVLHLITLCQSLDIGSKWLTNSPIPMCPCTNTYGPLSPALLFSTTSRAMSRCLHFSHCLMSANAKSPLSTRLASWSLFSLFLRVRAYHAVSNDFNWKKSVVITFLKTEPYPHSIFFEKFLFLSGIQLHSSRREVGAKWEFLWLAHSILNILYKPKILKPSDEFFLSETSNLGGVQTLPMFFCIGKFPTSVSPSTHFRHLSCCPCNCFSAETRSSLFNEEPKRVINYPFSPDYVTPCFFSVGSSSCGPYPYVFLFILHKTFNWFPCSRTPHTQTPLCICYIISRV